TSEARLRLPGRAFAEPAVDFAGSACRDARTLHESGHKRKSAMGRKQPIAQQPEFIHRVLRQVRRSH
ncbi:MAG TPA: hypothetical protein PK756_12855, partial [Piscinibacter sp.]|nr:hypothetical protein [Piscinibacter sp.]